ncbi:hypothetical protein RND81_06G040900 [Saponaria officinalis]|uniref:Uncharacterized protein n=1 Tax=Saponaria officinalis TaxID=3572 RepID=A0AAW1K6Z2_SAPOF
MFNVNDNPFEGPILFPFDFNYNAYQHNNMENNNVQREIPMDVDVERGGVQQDLIPNDYIGQGFGGNDSNDFIGVGVNNINIPEAPPVLLDLDPYIQHLQYEGPIYRYDRESGWITTLNGLDGRMNNGVTFRCFKWGYNEPMFEDK